MGHAVHFDTPQENAKLKIKERRVQAFLRKIIYFMEALYIHQYFVQTYQIFFNI